RGYFAKRFPETSLRLSYFLPTLLVAGLLGGGALSLAWPLLGPLYALGVGLYLLAVWLSAVMASRNLWLSLVVAAGIVVMHLTYGVWFVIGLLSSKLGEEAGEK
ncbi:MAG: hypothetical protein ACE5JA_09360, partial [bacterium]